VREFGEEVEDVCCEGYVLGEEGLEGFLRGGKGGVGG